MSRSPLESALEAVTDQASFLAFAGLLIADRVESVSAEKASPSAAFGPGANEWENGTIEDFLGAAVAWAADTHFGQSQGVSASTPWRQFAEFLYCGKIYE